MIFKGQCHRGAIRIELASDRRPQDQVLGACQCSSCRKHNARAFSAPKAQVTLTAADPAELQRYSFGLQLDLGAGHLPPVRRLCRDDLDRWGSGMERHQRRYA